MKTKLTLLMLAFGSFYGQAQTLYKQTFSGLTLATTNGASCGTIPATMFNINVGSKVADPGTNNIPFYASPYTQTAWVGVAFTSGGVVDTAAKCTSWFTPTG